VCRCLCCWCPMVRRRHRSRKSGNAVPLRLPKVTDRRVHVRHHASAPSSQPRFKGASSGRMYSCGGRCSVEMQFLAKCRKADRKGPPDCPHPRSVLLELVGRIRFAPLLSRVVSCRSGIVHECSVANPG